MAPPAGIPDYEPVVGSRLSDDQIAWLRPEGEVRATSAGEILFREGDATYDFIVILAGSVAVVNDYGGSERELAVGGPGGFVAELNLLTGERLYTTAVVREAGSVLSVPVGRLMDLIGRAPDLGDLILPTLFARRQWLVQRKTGFQIVGSRFSADTGRLREFADRNRLAHVWVDLDRDPSATRLLEDRGISPAQTPVVLLRGGGVLVNPSNVELARAVGLHTGAEPDVVYDLVVVGAGPAGLAASVYASSEGLRVARLDADGPGGQIGTTTRFQNYLGFPVGISGQEFAARAVIQAQRFGTRLIVPGRAVGLVERDGLVAVEMDDVDEVVGRSVIIATGIQYRRLDVGGIDRLEGISVFYSPLDEQNRVGTRDPVVVVGGGNSAGQAATTLASDGHRVTLVVRGGELAATMVRYLIDRIDHEPTIEVATHSQVVELVGDQTLEAVVVEDVRTGTRRRIGASAMFILIGAAPYSEWLAGALRLDDAGFVITGSGLGPDARAADPWRTLGRDPYPLEASHPGVFAGRCPCRIDQAGWFGGGDGSLAALLVHEWLGSPRSSHPVGR